MLKQKITQTTDKSLATKNAQLHLKLEYLHQRDWDKITNRRDAWVLRLQHHLEHLCYSKQSIKLRVYFLNQTWL
jgi:hypothetical protein